MPRKSVVKPISIRRIFSQEFKQDAVQMLLDGHTASSIVERLGISGTNTPSSYSESKQKLAKQSFRTAMVGQRKSLEILFSFRLARQCW